MDITLFYRSKWGLPQASKDKRQPCLHPVADSITLLLSRNFPLSSFHPTIHRNTFLVQITNCYIAKTDGQLSVHILFCPAIDVRSRSWLAEERARDYHRQKDTHAKTLQWEEFCQSSSQTMSTVPSVPSRIPRA